MAFKDREKELAYIKKYQSEKYDHINLMAPKGTKKDIQAAASLKNMSMSSFILYCIKKEVDRMKAD